MNLGPLQRNTKKRTSSETKQTSSECQALAEEYTENTSSDEFRKV